MASSRGIDHHSLTTLRWRDKRHGFTLIELLVVVAIIGILAAIAVPIYLNQRVSAWKATVTSDVHNAAKQVELASVHGDGSLTQLSAYRATPGVATMATAADTGSDVTVVMDKPFSNADGKYDGHGTIGSEPIPVSTGNTLEVQVKSDNSYTIYGVSTHVNDWVYRYDSARGTGEWERGSYPSDPAAPDPDDNCAVVLDGTKLIIGKDGTRCKLSTDMVNAVVGGNRGDITEIDLHGHVVIVDGSALFGWMPSLTSIPYLPGQSVTSSVNGVSYSSMFRTDSKLADADSISHWDTRNVTDMTEMFGNASSFNQPISNFNTSNVTNMYGMFENASVFNQPISNFDTSNVTNMDWMFDNASSFNQSVSNFNTSKVTSMYCMFDGALEFNQSVSNFNTSKVTIMGWMFNGARKFNQPVPFDTSKVTDMQAMFQDALSFNQPVPFDTSKATDMSYMFSSASSFNQSVSNFNTSKVTNMNHMFYYALSFNQPVPFVTSKATDMGSMFSFASSFNQDLTGWTVTNVTDHGSFSWESALTADHLPHFKS